MGARPRALELAVGLFVLLGAACLGWLSLRLGRVQVSGRERPIRAVFGSVEGLARDSSVEIAGVRVGRVKSLKLEGYRAAVVMEIDPRVKIQEDAIASIRTRGLIGEKYVSITPGASERLVPPGGLLHDTEDPLDFEQIIGQVIHGKL